MRRRRRVRLRDPAPRARHASAAARTYSARRTFARGPAARFFAAARSARETRFFGAARMSLIFHGLGRREIERRIPSAPMLTSSDDPP